MAAPRTAAGHKVDDEVDGWDPGVSEGEREKGGARCGAAGPGAGGPAHTEARKGRGEGEE